VRESVGEMVAGLTEEEWNRRPAGAASAAFHVRHIAGVIDRLFTYARGQALMRHVGQLSVTIRVVRSAKG